MTRNNVISAVAVAFALTVCKQTALASQEANAAIDSPICVLFTVDVETRAAPGGSSDLDIWGKVPGLAHTHGIERMMEILDAHGAKGTFFVNVYESPLHPEGGFARICHEIDRRGHDVELHTHPKPMFGVGYMQYADLARQTEILKRGAELLGKWAGTDVMAHRAGGYMANLDTLAACKRVGILLEFSHNIAWPQSGLAHADLTRNAPIVRDGVLVVPVTSYVQASLGGWQSLRFLDIESSSPAEIRAVVSDLHRHGVRTAVIMMHSFSFVRFGEPNLRAERALDELVAEFVADPDVKVVTARDLYDIWKRDPAALAGQDYLPTAGWWLTYCRAWQRLDEGWKNVAVAFAPLVLAAAAATGGAACWRRRRKRNRKAA